MSQKQKKPLAGGSLRDPSGDQLIQTSPTTLAKPKQQGKLDRMLYLFAEGARLHRFDAARLGDSVLNTTVSDLQRRNGIYFSRQRVKVPNRFGTETPVNEYWLAGKSLERARKICGLNREVVL